MSRRAVVASVLCLFASACGKPEDGLPVRPATVPTSAIWAGGPDGGAWVDCVALEGTAYRYRCAAYDEYAGSLAAKGEYVLSHYHWDEARKRASYEPVDRRPPVFEYDAFDGENIYLADSLVLIPDGWVNFPDETGGGKRLFEMGEPRGEGVRSE